MDIRIAIEWDARCGIPLSKVYPLREQVESKFKEVTYGNSIKTVDIILVCKEATRSPQKRYSKKDQEFYFVIILDFFLIMNSESIDQKKRIISDQILGIANQTFRKYKFEDFDSVSFLNDFEKFINSIKW
jgi:hypothetical protein